MVMKPMVPDVIEVGQFNIAYYFGHCPTIINADTATVKMANVVLRSPNILTSFSGHGRFVPTEWFMQGTRLLVAIATSVKSCQG